MKYSVNPEVNKSEGTALAKSLKVEKTVLNWFNVIYNNYFEQKEGLFENGY
jgi:hypothetical protein